jgi:glycosyltransferase involved in cell wall biosynthesis
MNNINLSVVIPTKNEEKTIRQFLGMCWDGINRQNLTAEILLMDSSSDSTPVIGEELGARVIKVQKSGLGVAYKEAQKFIRGEYVILGDADCTYDFREISTFILKLQQGEDLVIGNRFKGKIEKGSMPIHHRYFGTPGTSLYFRIALGIRVGDIHCGMRSLTSNLYRNLPFLEEGWEYSTEMIISARNLGAKVSEIPINYFKAPSNRISHQKRNGWMTPFRAGWGSVRVTTSFCLDRLLFFPGLAIAAIGGVANLLVFTNAFNLMPELKIGNLGSALFLTLSFIGSFMVAMGTLAKIIYKKTSRRLLQFLTNKRNLNLIIALEMISVTNLFYQGLNLLLEWRSGQFGFNLDGLKWGNSHLFAFNFSLFITANLLLCICVMSLVTYLQKTDKSSIPQLT